MNKFLRDGQGANSQRDDTEERDAFGDQNECFLSAPTEPKTIELSEIVAEKLPENKIAAPKIEAKVEVAKEKSVMGPDPVKGPCKKAKQMRLERKLQKLAKKGEPMETKPSSNRNQEKSLEDFLNEAPQDGAHKLQVCTY